MSKIIGVNGLNMTPCSTELGKFVRNLRMGLGLRQVQLANLSGISQNTISLLEVGRSKYLKPQHMEKLAIALKCDLEKLRSLIPKKYIARPKTEKGRLIRGRRQELGLTIEQLAQMLNMTCIQVNLLELDRHCGIKYQLVRPLVEALKLEPSIVAKFTFSERKKAKPGLGELIRNKRKELGLSMDMLSKKLGVERQFVDHMELGKTSLSNSPRLIEKLSIILEIPISELQNLVPLRRLKKVHTTDPLGRFLVAKRMELHLTQIEIAKRAKISHSVLSNIENGLICPNSKLLKKLTKALGNCEIPPDLISNNN